MTEKQLGVLTDFGYDVNVLDDAECKGLLEKLAANKWQPLPGGPARKTRKFDPNSPATKKQVAFLKDLGCLDTDGLTFTQASALIDELKSNRDVELV